MNNATRLSSWIVSHRRTGAVITCAGLVAGAALAAKRYLDTTPAGLQRAELKREEDLRTLALKISRYAGDVHKRYPTGEVVVSQWDLAMKLRKSSDAVAAALDFMLGERRVQRAALDGFWKLEA
jgi:hypothetical protein